MSKALHIAGGFYREICRHPLWNEFYGSGGRAAAALQGCGAAIHLHTFASDISRDNLEACAEAFEYQADFVPIPSTVSFNYFHPLSCPVIIPAPDSFIERPRITLEGECILRFGMLEGTAVVDGKRVVYDPQSPFMPEPFAQNGSAAEQLAIIANLGEAAKLTAQSELQRIGACLINDHNAEVAVIKNGADGAYVFTKDHASVRVPAYETTHVFKIGSGDIFSAVFAFFWATHQRDAVEAAELAAEATARYCENAVLPLTDLESNGNYPTVGLSQSTVADDSCPFDIYLAAPFFDIAQLWFVDELRKLLKAAGLKVFSPMHDVGRGSANDVAGPDLDGLNRSRGVLAWVDGLDAGTVFEIGYARAHGIPVTAYCERVADEDLKMIIGSGCDVVRDLTTAIYKAVWQVRRSGP